MMMIIIIIVIVIISGSWRWPAAGSMSSKRISPNDQWHNVNKCLYAIRSNDVVIGLNLMNVEFGISVWFFILFFFWLRNQGKMVIKKFSWRQKVSFHNENLIPNALWESSSYSLILKLCRPTYFIFIFPCNLTSKHFLSFWFRILISQFHK